jgi:signal transduction histidine kinase
MNFNIFPNQVCGNELPGFLGLDFSTAPQLLFYSYTPIILISLFIGIWVFLKERKSLQGKLFFSLTVFFALWVVNIIIQWVSSYHVVLMFAWQLTAFFELGMYISAGYFSYVFLFKKDISYFGKVLLLTIFALVCVFLPTKFNIASYDILNCEGVVGNMWKIIYIIESCLVVWISYIGYINYKTAKEINDRKKVTLFTLGMVFFLFIFFLSNFYAEVTKVYEFNLWGPLGMLIFISCLSYLTVKFKIFNLKLIGSNVLVLSLWILTASLLTIQDIDTSHAVTGITLIISIIFGFILIQSVRKEVSQREKIEKLAFDLTSANNRLLEIDKQKSEFVSFATHQLRAPLTAMKGYTSLILEGEMGKVNPEVKQAVKRIFDSSSTLENIVDDYLNISRIELGTLQYNFDMIDLKDVLENVVEELKPNIEKKGLAFDLNINPSGINSRFIVRADKDKIKQVITNLIDNSVKYTPSGSIDISLNKDINKRKILVSIKDTGVGISPDVMPKLFSKFVRADNANKQNIFGTGLGLYIASQIALAHHGRIWAESMGEGKGSQFYLQLDMEV